MGIGGGGIFRNYLERGGGYYIDVGCSQIIADGHIKVKQSINGIDGFSKDSLQLASGEEVPADIVVLATGYDNMRTTLRKVFGDDVADQCKDVWGIDEEGEVNAMWRNSVSLSLFSLELLSLVDADCFFPVGSPRSLVHGW